MYRIISLLIILSSTHFAIGQDLNFTEKSGDFQFSYNYNGNSVFGIGVSLYDFDLDGYDDISFGGTHTENPHFFRSTGTNIEEVTISGLGLLTASTEALLWVDFDNDGDMDLSANNIEGPNKVFLNNGELNLIDISADFEGMTTTTMYSYSGAWGDYDRDGLLDFYCPNRDAAQVLDSQNKLYRNNGNNTFSDVSVAAGAHDPQVSFQSVFTDYNRDGWPDIYTTNDKYFTNNTLLENQGDGTFLSVADPDNMGKAMDGMGIAAGDYNNDGYEDYYVTNTEQSSVDFGGNLFCKNYGGQFFTEVGDSLGVRIFAFGWGCVWADFDNDGHLDLYVSNSSGVPGNSIFKRNRLFIGQGDGTFEEDTTTNIANTYDNSFGCAVGDLNNDGYPDIVQVNTTDNFKIWLNDGGLNNWVKVTLEGTQSNRMGIGSWIETYYNGNVSYRYTRCGNSYGSQDGRATMIGLGSSTQIDSMIIRWPSGIVDVILNPGINQTHHIVEPSIITEIETRIHSENRLMVSPNPSNGQLTITSDKAISSILVYSLDGRIVHTSDLVESPDKVRTLDLTDIHPGLYLLKVQAQGHAWETRRLVINDHLK